MYTTHSHELVFVDHAPRYLYVLHDKPTSPEEEQEAHLRYAKKLFDDMWHALITLQRPLKKEEYRQYQDLFTGVLNLHQDFHSKGAHKERHIEE